MPRAEMFVTSTFEALLPGGSELIFVLLNNIFHLLQVSTQQFNTSRFSHI